jgi:hypothetical protein
MSASAASAAEDDAPDRVKRGRKTGRKKGAEPVFHDPLDVALGAFRNLTRGQYLHVISIGYKFYKYHGQGLATPL